MVDSKCIRCCRRYSARVPAESRPTGLGWGRIESPCRQKRTAASATTHHIFCLVPAAAAVAGRPLYHFGNQVASSLVLTSLKSAVRKLRWAVSHAARYASGMANRPLQDRRDCQSADERCLRQPRPSPPASPGAHRWASPQHENRPLCCSAAPVDPTEISIDPGRTSG